MFKQLVGKNTMELLARDIHHHQMLMESNKNEIVEGEGKLPPSISQIEETHEKINIIELECHNELRFLNQQISFLKVVFHISFFCSYLKTTHSLP